MLWVRCNDRLTADRMFAWTHQSNSRHDHYSALSSLIWCSFTVPLNVRNDIERVTRCMCCSSAECRFGPRPGSPKNFGMSSLYVKYVPCPFIPSRPFLLLPFYSVSSPFPPVPFRFYSPFVTPIPSLPRCSAQPISVSDFRPFFIICICTLLAGVGSIILRC